jgi:hypothetical protein
METSRKRRRSGGKEDRREGRAEMGDGRWEMGDGPGERSRIEPGPLGWFDL